jgi:hypothetical protein
MKLNTLTDTTKTNTNMKKYSHAFDVAFQLTNHHEDPNDTPLSDLLDAMQKRLDTLREAGDSARAAFGAYDSCEDY